MSTKLRVCSLVLAVLLTSCTSRSESSGSPVATTSSAIAYGVPDTTHTAVVSLLAPGEGGSFSECTGTIVQMKSGQAYVLTAAHCCNQGDLLPSIVVVANDYSLGESALFGGAVNPPVYSVEKSSIYFDADYDGNGSHDFCMLKFTSGTTLAVIPVPAGEDGLALGTQLDRLGYGVTSTADNNTHRYLGAAPVGIQLTDSILTSAQGDGGTGTPLIPGFCEGDSGGPLLAPAGTAQASQTVVGVASYGNSASCAQATTNYASRVSSALGASGFITKFLADAPIGTPATGAQTCEDCSLAAEGGAGACASQTTACSDDSNCLKILSSSGSCASDPTCLTNVEADAGTTATVEYNAFNTCICGACTSSCASECGGSTDAGTVTDAGSGTHPGGADAGSTGTSGGSGSTKKSGCSATGFTDAMLLGVLLLLPLLRRR